MTQKKTAGAAAAPRPQDDLYLHVNGEAIAKRKIPADKARVGTFSDLADDVEKILIKDLSAPVRKDAPDKWAYAAALFKKAADNPGEPKEKIKALLPGLRTIEAIDSVQAFNAKFGELARLGAPLPFSWSVEADMKAAHRHALTLAGPATILPDTAYYKKGNPDRERLLGVWRQVVKDLLLDLPKADGARVDALIADALRFDAAVARIVKSRREWADYPKCYNPTPTARVARLLAPFSLDAGLAQLFPSLPKKIVVADPRFLKNFARLFTPASLPRWRAWAYVHYVLGNAGLLCERLRVRAGAYRRALTGVKEAPKPERYAYDLVAFSLLPQVVGIHYGNKYFGAKAKAAATAMVANLVDAYRARLKANPWLSAATKAKAARKLASMVPKMGFPDALPPFYRTLRLDVSKPLFAIVQQLRRAQLKFEIEQLDKPVDRSVWAMPAHMVNACYSPSHNDITFPAAILQAPYFSLKRTNSQNYGGIGVIIGHEISHAFDNNGAQFDAAGNLKNWWAKADYAQFRKKTAEMVAQFDGLPQGAGKVDGRLVVSENIADLGGYAAALQALEKIEPNPDYRAFFFSQAEAWRMKASPELEMLYLRIDVHAPAAWRANMPPRNLPQWYAAFGATSKDKMYLPPGKRLQIW